MREEYPRPSFKRNRWINLNGQWDFEIADKKTSIEVPFVYQSKLSGIDERLEVNRVTYRRQFTIPDSWKNENIILHFGAVDYRCRVYVNERFVGEHVGGQTPFSFCISEFLSFQKESIRVEVEDPLHDELIPRGKQSWEKEPRFIWYTPSTGIWQTVWVEPVSDLYITSLEMEPDIDEGKVKIEYEISESEWDGCLMQILISLEGERIYSAEVLSQGKRNRIWADVFRRKAMDGAFHFVGQYWSPENPILYDIELKLVNKEGAVSDEVVSYFGMRKVHVEKGRLYLNNQPYYQRLILDQGYWKEGLLTAPSQEAYREDIQKAKEMGFNGCRKHEKAEDPIFLYWADKMGFLVWASTASFWNYSKDATVIHQKEWIESILRDFNHPCIIAWDMLNESWGVPQIYDNERQQSYSEMLYHLAKALDGTRPVISNDGWEQADTDICTIHSYMHGEKTDIYVQNRFAEALSDIDSLATIMEKNIFVKNQKYAEQPIVISECGGISLNTETTSAMFKQGGDWGYTSANAEEFLEEYARIINAIYDSDIICGFCYTQLTDVEQEINGLLTNMRDFKFSPQRIAEITLGKQRGK